MRARKEQAAPTAIRDADDLIDEAAERLADIDCALKALKRRSRRGEIRHQRDLLVGERAHLLPKEVEGADQLVFLEHWNAEHSPETAQFGADCILWSAAIGRFDLHVRNLNGLFGRGHASEPSSMDGAEHRIAPSRFDKRRRSTMQRNCPKGVALEQIHRAKLGFANSRRVRQHGLEDWLQLTRRA